MVVKSTSITKRSLNYEFTTQAETVKKKSQGSDDSWLLGPFSSGALAVTIGTPVVKTTILSFQPFDNAVDFFDIPPPSEELSSSSHNR